VGLLWFCGFFNYADRQAVNSVFPLLQSEFGLSSTQLGMLGSAFMVIYALAAPLAGFVVDQASRRTLIVAGLAFWSLICAATGAARSFAQLVFFRAAEGLGESFYFPASMSLLADYHGPKTRSRAMSVHQTSVYVGTAGGGFLAGLLGELWGWRSPFWILGLVGLAYAGLLAVNITEPKREGFKGEGIDPEFDGEPVATGLTTSLAEIVRVPAAVFLLIVFAGANFVASAFLTWLPMFIFKQFGQGLARSSLISTLFPLASLVGALAGGVLADRAAKRPGGRMRVQGIGLICGAPFIVAAGLAPTVTVFVVPLMVVGICKGIYDANIFASVYDVVPARVRGTAAGLMNTVGWAGGSLAPLAIGLGADRIGLGPTMARLAAVYVVVGVLAVIAGTLVPGKSRTPGEIAP
jgi:MFS family permease